jgi:hypothetical protein
MNGAESKATHAVVGDRVPHARLDTVHSRYEHSLNFEYGDILVSVTDRAEPYSPFGVNLPGWSLAGIKRLERKNGDLLAINDAIEMTLTPDQIYRSDLKSALGGHGSIPRQRIERLKSLLLARTESNPMARAMSGIGASKKDPAFERELLRQFSLAWGMLKRKRWSEAASGFRGRGWGSTPSGDDFLAGLLLGLRLREQSERKKLSKIVGGIYVASKSKNPLVNTFLHQAERGWADSDYRGLISSLADGSSGLEGWVGRIVSRGSSSGADGLLGFLAAWEQEI